MKSTSPLWFVLLLTTSTHAATITLHPDQQVCKDFVGFGAQFSPFITAPNLNQPVGDITDLERKLIALAPQHVRIFVLTDWWGEADEANKNSFIRTVQIAQKAGASVNVTLWYGWRKHPQESAEQMARILADLIRDRKLDCVRYVTLQNEVNNTAITMQQYDHFYRYFDAQLRQFGLRDQIKIVAGDLLGMNQEAWLRNLSEELGDICDGYSFHTYWEFDNTDHLVHRIDEFGDLMKRIPPPGSTKPLYMTEFGVRGRGWKTRGPGTDDHGNPIAQTSMQAEQIGWMMMHAVNHGIVATVQWEAYDVYYDHPMHCGLLGEPGEGFPIRPSYKVQQLFTHATAPGWQAVLCDGETADQTTLAMRGPKDEWSVFVQNRSEKPESITITALPQEISFRQIEWTAADKLNLTDRGETKSTAIGQLQATLPPHSITAFIAGSERWKQLLQK